MKIAILSRAPSCLSTRRLREDATERGHEFEQMRVYTPDIDVRQRLTVSVAELPIPGESSCVTRRGG